MKNTELPTTQPTPLWPVIASLAFVCLGWISTQLDDPATRASYVWIASAVSISALYLAPFSRWPAYLIALAAGAILLNLATQESLPMLAAFTANELISAAAAAWLLKRSISGGRLDTVERVLAFVFIGAFGGAVMSSFGGAGFISAVENREFWTEWRVWLVANCVGTLVVAPFIIEWAGFRARRSGGMTRAGFATGAALFLLLVASSLFVFDTRTLERFSGTVGLALTYLPLPFLVLAAIAWGSRGGTLAMLTLAAIAIVNTHQGEGPFAAQDATVGESVFEAQLYVAAAALMTLLMAALRASQERALKESADWRARYEMAITANHNVMFELEPRSHILAWGGDPRAVVGIDRGALTSLDQLLARAHNEDRERLHLAFDALVAGATTAASLVFRAIGDDGRTRFLEISAGAVVDFDDEIHRVTGLVREAPPSRHGDDTAAFA